MADVGHNARDGALIRDAESVQHLENANALAVAETGALTEGRPKFARRSIRGDVAEERRLFLAPDIERPSRPPAGAVADSVMDRGRADLDTERRACTCRLSRLTRFALRPFFAGGASAGQGRMSPSAIVWKRSTT